MPGKKINTTAKGNRYERIFTNLLKAQRWYVEKARVSRGKFDLIAIRDDVRFVIQVKVNGYPEEKLKFWSDPDPLYLTSPHERVWITPWVGRKTKRGLWSCWYTKRWEGIFQGFTLVREDFRP